MLYLEIAIILQCFERLFYYQYVNDCLVGDRV